VRLALCQLEIDVDAPFAERVRHATDVVRAQDGCDLVVLPELWAHGAFLFQRFADEAQAIDGPLVAALCAAARDAGVWLHGGSFAERADDGRLFNTTVLIDDSGVVRATYRKVHLFGFRGGESTVLSAGEDVVTCETPFGVIGLSTCYDLRFPELFRALVDRGAVLCLVPAAWPERRAAHWQVLTRARAIEDQLVVAACNAVGLQGEVRLAGLSLVVDAWGDLLAESPPDGEDVLHVDVDLAEVARTRASFPVLDDRRL
jgi:predicted amidohydrolase